MGLLYLNVIVIVFLYNHVMVIDKNSVDYEKKAIPKEERDLLLGRVEASSEGQ